MIWFMVKAPVLMTLQALQWLLTGFVSLWVSDKLERSALPEDVVLLVVREFGLVRDRTAVAFAGGHGVNWMDDVLKGGICTG